MNITSVDVNRLRWAVYATLIWLGVMGIAALVMGTYVPAIVSVQSCVDPKATMTSLFGACNAANALGYLAHIISIGVLAILVMELSAIANAVHGLGGWISSVFTKDGNNSLLIMTAGLIIFIINVVGTTAYTALPNYLIALSLKLTRDGVVGAVLVTAAMAVLKKGSFKDLLTEITAPGSDAAAWIIFLAMYVASSF